MLMCGGIILLGTSLASGLIKLPAKASALP
jgi:hypothetical protein